MTPCRKNFDVAVINLETGTALTLDRHLGRKPSSLIESSPSLQGGIRIVAERTQEYCRIPITFGNQDLSGFSQSGRVLNQRINRVHVSLDSHLTDENPVETPHSPGCQHLEVALGSYGS